MSESYAGITVPEGEPGGLRAAASLEQRRLIARGMGWVISSTSDAISFADKGEIMAECAETFRVENP